MELLAAVCISESELVTCTSDVDSLGETKRRQNVRESVLNIIDSVFAFFFMVLDKRCWDFLSFETLLSYGENIFHGLKSHILHDKELTLAWTGVYKDTYLPLNPNINESSSL
jgi:hypothetical protein